MDIDSWRSEAENLNQVVSTMVDDRKFLKNYMSKYLKNFFDYDSIKFSENFHRIEMLFNVNNVTLVTPKNIGQLNMLWKIGTGFTDEYGTTIRVVVYPFD